VGEGARGLEKEKEEDEVGDCWMEFRAMARKPSGFLGNQK
jgi:hypothetical protein